MKTTFNAISLLKGLKGKSDDFLPEGTHTVNIVEFYLKELKEPNADNGYVDQTTQLVAWFQNGIGRMPHYFSVGGFVKPDEVYNNTKLYIERANPKDLGLTAKEWKAMDDEQKLEAAYGVAGKFAVYNHKDGAMRILDPKRSKATIDILQRFAGAVMGADYELEGETPEELVANLSRDFVGKAVKIHVTEDMSGKLTIDASKIGAFKKA